MRSAMTSAALMLLGAAGAAHGGIVATAAQVYHTIDVPLVGPPAESIVLNSSSPGSIFSTFNGHAGVTADFSGPGTLRLDGYGVLNLTTPDSPGYNWEYTRGWMNLSVVDGTVSPTLSTLGQGVYFGGTITLKNLDLDQIWSIRFGPFTPITSGDLVLPAPSGNYGLTWDTRVTYMAGTTGSGTVTLNLNYVPEPSVLATMLPMAMVRRRR